MGNQMTTEKPNQILIDFQKKQCDYHLGEFPVIEINIEKMKFLNIFERTYRFQTNSSFNFTIKVTLNLNDFTNNRIIYNDGTIYEGCFNLTYNEGLLVDDHDAFQPHGNGCLTFTNGAKYYGKFVEGYINGPGYLIIDNKRYSGNCLNGEFTEEVQISDELV